jgi:hypothetical protein
VLTHSVEFPSSLNKLSSCEGPDQHSPENYGATVVNTRDLFLMAFAV